MQISFQKATRRKAKLRLALIAPSGHGKTYSALALAKGLGGKTAFIDTEAGSGDLYATQFDYDIIQMNAPYLAEKYIAAIKAAEEAGYDNLIIDSLTHAWAGSGGLLDMQGKLTDSGKANSFTAWRKITPMHNQLVDTILGSKCHVIATIRSKTEYAVDKDDSGRSQVKKLGLAPVQRDGVEYEMTVVFDIDKNHIASVSKDRTGLFDNQFVKLDEDVGKKLSDWLNEETDNAAKNKKEPTIQPMVGNGSKSNL